MSTSPPPTAKKMKLNVDLTTEEVTPASDPAAIESSHQQPTHCQHFVERKKRFCKMSVARGRNFCGEHLPDTIASSHEDSYIPPEKQAKRIPCPLDPKHTVFAWKLAHHLKICNAKAPTALPAYIVKDVNRGGDSDDEHHAAIDPAAAIVKLSELPVPVLDELIAKINRLYDEHSIGAAVTELHLDHRSMDAELARDIYGPETLKHLRQTAAILGLLQHFQLLDPLVASSYVEFGAGKGHLSYWLAQIVKDARAASNVILVDRASHRHKQDNKVAERDVVHRIRADIADLDVRRLQECAQAERLIGVSKHLCGAATDLAVRCMLQDAARTQGFVIALCCHHRCEWRSFVGKGFFRKNGLSRNDFGVMTKLVSWAVCGSGMSRETRKANAAEAAEAEAKTHDGSDSKAEQENKIVVGQRLSRDERETIGRKCKRLLDYARVDYLRTQCDLEANLHYYIGADVTLENVCIVGRRKAASKPTIVE